MLRGPIASWPCGPQFCRVPENHSKTTIYGCNRYNRSGPDSELWEPQGPYLVDNICGNFVYLNLLLIIRGTYFSHVCAMYLSIFFSRNVFSSTRPFNVLRIVRNIRVGGGGRTRFGINIICGPPERSVVIRRSRTHGSSNFSWVVNNLVVVSDIRWADSGGSRITNYSRHVTTARGIRRPAAAVWTFSPCVMIDGLVCAQCVCVSV